MEANDERWWEHVKELWHWCENKNKVPDMLHALESNWTLFFYVFFTHGGCSNPVFAATVHSTPDMVMESWWKSQWSQRLSQHVVPCFHCETSIFAVTRNLSSKHKNSTCFFLQAIAIGVPGTHSVCGSLVAVLVVVSRGGRLEFSLHIPMSLGVGSTFVHFWVPF